ncbi:MAG TPA: DUF4239 domain-containing protein [Candidatus Acidoferrum sp.]|nr:DUF4239 domain-containing protein [Candidatus Acidoferrum sp.]
MREAWLVGLINRLYAIPWPILLTCAIVVTVVVACSAQFAIYRRFGKADFIRRNEVAGFITVVGTLYAVVLGFMTVVVWQQYDTVQTGVALETGAVSDTWHNAVGFPPTVRRQLRVAMQGYAHEMIDVEWPRMRHGGFSVRGDNLIMEATGTVGSYVPVNGAETNAQAMELRLLTELHDTRLRRISSNESGLSAFNWIILTLGAVVVIAFCWLFGTSNPRVHLVMTAAVTILITSMFVMIFELQFPFRGDLGIRSTPWVALLDHIRYMDRMSTMNMRM